MSATLRTASPRQSAPSRTRRRDTDPPGRTLVRGGLVIAVVGVLVWLAVSAYNGVPFEGYSTFYVSVPQAGNLLQHDPVRIAGVRVGQVLSKTIGADGRVRLTLQLEPGMSLPADTTVAIRAQGLLGSRYVELIAGHSSRKLAPGATITAPAAALTYGVPEALDTLDAQTRGALGTTVRVLGKGMLGHGAQLNDTIRLDAPQMVPFQQLATTILSHPGAAQRLLPALDRMTSVLSASGERLARTFAPAATALAPVVSERAAVRAALEQAPSALQSADSGLTDAERLLDATRAVATAANGTLPYAPSGLHRLTALLAGSHPALERSTSLLQAAQPAVPAVLRITASLRPLLRPLLQGLRNLTPMLGQLAPYGCNIENFGAVFRSMTGFGGTGTGPHGPAMAFRLTVVPPAGQGFFGARDTSGLTSRDGYPPPCKYLASSYPAVGTHVR
jgi:phospholipid/cholesterol/gamma-HCH transport system substrate-binding protein